MIEFKVAKKSFTLMEIMLVIAIIAILAALTIPNIQRQRINANEQAAISALKLIHTALETYKDIYSAFPANPTVLTSGPSPFIPSELLTFCGCDALSTPCPGCPDEYHGYQLCYRTLNNYTYYCSACPYTPNVTGTRYFRVTKSGVIEVRDSGGIYIPLE